MRMGVRMATILLHLVSVVSGCVDQSVVRGDTLAHDVATEKAQRQQIADST